MPENPNQIPILDTAMGEHSLTPDERVAYIARLPRTEQIAAVLHGLRRRWNERPDLSLGQLLSQFARGPNPGQDILESKDLELLHRLMTRERT